jgi:hypothetical protein
MPRAIALAPLLALLGCSETGVSSLDRPVVEDEEPIGDPILVVQPSSATFPDTLIGEAATAAVTLSNPGEVPVRLLDTAILGDGPFQAAMPPGELAPGASTVIEVRFAPTEHGMVEDALRVQSDAPATPTATVALSGDTLRPELTVTPGIRDFGAVPLGDVDQVDVRVDNIGEAPATLLALAFAATSEELALTDDGGLSAGPRVVAPGQSATFTVIYQPRDGVPDESTLSISTDAPGQSTLVAEQMGVGRALSTCDPAGRPFGGGLGTESDPHMLCAPEHVDAIRTEPEDHFLVEQDIDMAGFAFTPIPRLAGSLDGAGHALSNLVIDAPRTDAVAFVVTVDEHATLRDLVFLDASVTGRQRVATVFWANRPGARVEDVVVEGGRVEALRGIAAGIGDTVAGGSTLEGATFVGDVIARGEGYAAGIANQCHGTCRDLIAEGTVRADSWKAGGIVHIIAHGGLVESCVSRMDVSSPSRVGGIASMLSTGTIRDCYSEGDLTGDNWVGGLVSESYRGSGRIESSYASSPISAAYASAGCQHGGIIACRSGATIVDTAWDVDRSGVSITSSDGGTPLSTAEMRDPGTAVFSSWGPAWVFTAGDHPRLAIE